MGGGRDNHDKRALPTMGAAEGTGADRFIDGGRIPGNHEAGGSSRTIRGRDLDAAGVERRGEMGTTTSVDDDGMEAALEGHRAVL